MLITLICHVWKCTHSINMNHDSTPIENAALCLDPDLLAAFSDRAEKAGISLQTLVNQTLRANLQAVTLLDEENLRRIIREELWAVGVH